MDMVTPLSNSTATASTSAQITAESLEAVKELPLSAWEPTNASYGTMGAYFEEGFDYNDVDEEEIVLTYIYAIQEYNS
jgi:hypothetical protein